MRPRTATQLVRALPANTREPLRRLVAAADALGFALYLVGGPVRDWLLGRAPGDLDLLVADPRARRGNIARLLAEHASSLSTHKLAENDERVTGHARFGTAQWRGENFRIDLARARREHYRAPGALPTVAASGAQEDLRRRDFTVNALALPLGRVAREEVRAAEKTARAKERATRTAARNQKPATQKNARATAATTRSQTRTTQKDARANERAAKTGPRGQERAAQKNARAKSANTNPSPAPAQQPHARPSLLDGDGGLADLHARRLRIFHPRSFHDDPTRALRAVRFELRLNFRITRETFAALQSALRDGAFGAVSGARLRAEFEKLFADITRGLDPARALRRLDALHILGALEPGLCAPPSALPALRRFARLLQSDAPPPAPAPWLTGFMLWCAALPAALRRRWLERLALAGAPAARIMGFPRARERWLRALARARGRGALDAVLHPLAPSEVLALWASAPPPLARRILRHLRDDRAARLPISGDDLLALGLRGPAVGRALAGVRAAVLDRVVKTRDDALVLAREIARRGKIKNAGRARAARYNQRTPGSARPKPAESP